MDTSLFTLLVYFMVSSSLVIAQTYTEGLVTALNAANLTTLASLAQNNTNFVTLLENGGNKTLLAPTDEALVVVADASASLLEATLQYHILNGTVRESGINGEKNYIASTFLTLQEYVSLPDGRSQAIVLRKANGDGNIPYVAGASRNSTFANSTDGSTYENVLIQPIDAVAFIPSNLSSTLTAINATTFFQATNLTSQLAALSSSRDGLTIFVPTNEAMDAAGAQIVSASESERANVLANHVLNGTLVYSTQLQGSGAMASAVSSSGNVLSFSSQNNNLEVTSGNATARITRADILVSNAVIHIINTVLFNTSSNPEAAASAFQSATGKPAPSATRAASAENAAAITHVHVFGVAAAVAAALIGAAAVLPHP
ncbi:FAS1 domain-containing protein [Tilletiaria anomala UBC 951]|uniref:FAS1 domain-containing protein n=1 Tax=Tilletiaria anomala (strain ATCC 24038 / CBS 436.72 / UBC 951) TaxID=1037660 RepID=A0A066W0A4_TILAU|nr:FAS1 domain-containing protein [Tilletiaria anomala UBC 951]KDN44494.1 FAS1 domain-containing protein [Tilletiaria anomala UBC 951]